MESLFHMQLCKALQEPAKPRSVLAPYFDSFCDPKRRYHTPPVTPPAELQTPDDTQANTGKPLNLDSNDTFISPQTSLRTTVSPTTASTTKLGTSTGSVGIEKKRKRDESTDNEQAREKLGRPHLRQLKHRHATNASALCKSPSHMKRGEGTGVETMGEGKKRKCDVEEEVDNK
jgi:hypothetical protein